MFNLTRWSPFDELFDFQRAVDRMFDQFWSDLPTRTAPGSPGSFQLTTSGEEWRLDVPMPGIDPKHVALEAAGHTLSIRAEVPGEGSDAPVTRYERSVTLPQFLDLDKLSASHRHGMLELRIPIKESVKPRRIEIQAAAEEERKQLTSA